MLMKDNKKQLVSLIVNKAKGENHIDNLKPADTNTSAPEMEDGVQQDSSVPEEIAAEELISALELKSPKAIVEALKALMELCR